MKIKHEEVPICFWSNKVNGRYEIKFKSTENIEMVDALSSCIKELSNKYSSLGLQISINVYGGKTHIDYSRKLNNDELILIKKWRKEDRIKTKERELAYAKKLAKKHKLI